MTEGFSQAITNHYAQWKNKGGVKKVSCLSLQPFSDPVSIAGYTLLNENDKMNILH